MPVNKARKSVRLSELEDHIEISIEEDSEVLTVKDLKRHITELGEEGHEYSNWYVIERKRWKPNAQYMLETYIEQEYDNMYEDWDSRAMDCLTKDVVDKMQALLDEAFKGDSATEYWSYEMPVEIDVFPKQNNKKGNR